MNPIPTPGKLSRDQAPAIRPLARRDRDELADSVLRAVAMLVQRPLRPAEVDRVQAIAAQAACELGRRALADEQASVDRRARSCRRRDGEDDACDRAEP